MPTPVKAAHHHGHHLRGLTILPRSVFHEGRFGRLFRNLPGFEPDDELLIRLAGQMVDDTGDDPAGDNKTIPAGFTYLGQFLDHDITFDPVSSLTRQNDPDALHDFRTPRLDLDSVYSTGPDDAPFLYDNADPDLLLIGSNGTGEDLPRNQQGRALIGDPRNDENLIVAQLHLVFLKFHNQVVRDIRARRLDAHLWSTAPADVFREAQRIVRWHYQWIIATDFLPRVAGPELVDQILVKETRADGTVVRHYVARFYHFRVQPFMPVEFSAAAYRFGHSMIRPDYELNDQTQDVPIFSGDPNPDPLKHLGGNRPLPEPLRIDWSFFFDLASTDDKPQLARKIDTHIAKPLATLPATVVVADGIFRSLPFRNLERGKHFDLPAGQVVARAMGVKSLNTAELGPAIHSLAPLWFYVLREAEKRHAGRHLGEVGGRIVAEVILGLINGDPLSFPRTEPGFMPFLPSSQAGKFTMVDLLHYVGF